MIYVIRFSTLWMLVLKLVVFVSETGSCSLAQAGQNSQSSHLSLLISGWQISATTYCFSLESAPLHAWFPSTDSGNVHKSVKNEKSTGKLSWYMGWWKQQDYNGSNNTFYCIVWLVPLVLIKQNTINPIELRVCTWPPVRQQSWTAF